MESIDKRVDLEDPLDAFLLESQAFAPPRRGAQGVAVATAPPARGPATVHDITAVLETRMRDHVSKESAEVRRRLLDMTQALEHAIARQAAEIDRLNLVVRIAIYFLLAIGLTQLGFLVWTSRQ